MKTTIVTTDSKGKNYEMIYELIEENCCLNGNDYIGYGIKLTEIGIDEKSLVSVCYKDITTCYEKAVDFFKLLTKNYVKSDIIEEIMEDFLA